MKTMNIKDKIINSYNIKASVRERCQCLVCLRKQIWSLEACLGISGGSPHAVTPSSFPLIFSPSLLYN